LLSSILYKHSKWLSKKCVGLSCIIPVPHFARRSCSCTDDNTVFLLIAGEIGRSLGLAAERLRPCVCDAPTARRQGTVPQNFFFTARGKKKSFQSFWLPLHVGLKADTHDGLETKIQSCLSALFATAVRAVWLIQFHV